MDIAEKTFLISGGASGLGAATTRMLVQQGANVVIADRNDAAGQAMVTDLGRRTRFSQTDVTDEDSVQQAVTLALKVFGGLHGAISCAGIGIPEKVVGDEGPHRLATFEKVIQVNLTGTFNVIRLAADTMVKGEVQANGERGVIINTASIAAFEGQLGQASYAASKGGIVSMTLPVARELARYGIRVMTIAPGIFDTPMLAELSDEVRASLGQQTPFPSRLGRPDEYAALVRHIIENEMLNGEVIRLDGAMRMAAK
ncbi:MAG: 3-hydroxyacyl-CoA dehydrogenase [Gammaproteobacteria bacterium]|nr:MAG: 3-hydroxyacyl-CoA dehydrogenase [Gammaproteobacteria bacterium]